MERVYIYVVDLCVSCEIYVHGSSSIVRQKHESALDGTCSCSDAIDCDVGLN